jgi:hypothetical protein
MKSMNSVMSVSTMCWSSLGCDEAVIIAQTKSKRRMTRFYGRYSVGEMRDRHRTDGRGVNRTQSGSPGVEKDTDS